MRKIDGGEMIDPLAASWVDEYRGLELSEVLTLAEQRGLRVRVIHPGDTVQADFNPARLNVVLNEEAGIERLWRG